MEVGEGRRRISPDRRWSPELPLHLCLLGGRVEKTYEQRVGRLGAGPQLRLVQRRHEEPMIRSFDRPDLAKFVDANWPHPTFRRDLLDVTVEAVVACGVLDNRVGVVVCSGQPRARGQADRDVTAVDRTRQKRDDRCAAHAVLRVGGVDDADLRTSMLYQNMLKAASRGDEGKPFLAGGPDHFLGGVWCDVWGAWTDYDVVRQILEVGGRDRVGLDDLHGHVESGRIGRMANRCQSGLVIRTSSWDVEDHVNTNRHA